MADSSEPRTVERETLRERVRQTFGDATDDQVKDYLEQLRTNWRDVEKFNRRNMSLAIIVGALFELTTHNAINELAILNIKFNSVPFLKFVLPVLVAYLYVMNIIHVTEAEFFDELHGEIYKLKFPKFHLRNMEIPIQPVGIFTDHFLFSDRLGPGLSSVEIISLVRGIIPYFFLPILVTYMIVRLFFITPISSPVLFISAALSAVFVLAGLSYIKGTSIGRSV